MKLLYITTKISGAGGMQRVLLLKAAYLAENLGYRVTILVTNPVEEEIFYNVSPAIAVTTIQPDKSGKISYFRSYKKLLNQSIEAINPDVVVMCDNGFKSFLLPFILTKKRPLVYELHISRFIQEQQTEPSFINALQRKITHKFADFCAARFDKFVVLTKQGVAEWPLKTIDVIPNPLWFTTDAVGDLVNKRVVTVGRHSYEKGYDRLFAAWKQINERYPDWQLDIYGDDNPDYDVRELAVKSGFNGVNFLKPTKDIVSAYLNASLYLMASRYEGFGMVLLEAMACGLPCVAYNCPVGPQGIITDSVDGFLINDGDTDAFVAAVIKLIEDDKLRIKMGARAKANSGKFAINPIMQQWDTLFKSLL